MFDDFEATDFEAMHDDGWSPLEAGAVYALYRHGQDRQTVQIANAITEALRPVEPVEPPPVLVNAAAGKAPPQWDLFIGQEATKAELKTFITDANHRGRALAHILLASGQPGVGKTTLARLIAAEMGSELIMLVPPFHRDTLFEAAMRLPDQGILFIDEVHRLMQQGRGAAENLLHMLEERRLYTDDGVIELNDITVIGATTDVDRLPETIIDRFPIKPYFEPYNLKHMVQITAIFEVNHDVNLGFELNLAIAKASRFVPRVARELVYAARALRNTLGREPTPEELLTMKQLEPDGMTRDHIAYLTKLYRHFPRERDGMIEYIAGEATLMSVLKQTRQGIHRIEAFLLERGLIDRTPSGRRLTSAGINQARDYVERGL